MTAGFAAWPETVWSAGVACGIKPGVELDLGLLVTERPAGYAGVFTQNAARAAPVEWCHSLLGLAVRAVVVNSGNANACTGDAGEAAVEETAVAAASAIGCHPEEVLVASTGPIGVPLPAELIASALPDAVDALGRDPEEFARALMTTDTRPKHAASQAAGIVGCAKGAAMLAPNMATMLAFLVTDAPLDMELLQESLAEAVERTFNRISIDACESTNDSVILLSTGLGREVDRGVFGKELETVCASLAEQIARDAEGGTRLVRVRVTGAPDDAAAAGYGRAVAASTLWRAAVHGADPNWGRVLAALGAFDRSLDLATLEVAIGGAVVFASGAPRREATAAAAEAMALPEFDLSVRVGPGDGVAEVLTSDLSPEYVSLNAGGTT